MSDANSIFLGKGETLANLLLSSANRHGLIAGATGTGKTATLRVLDSQGKAVVTASTAIAEEKNLHCPTFPVGSLWWGLVGHGYSIELTAPSLTTFGGRPSSGVCRVRVDEYF